MKIRVTREFEVAVDPNDMDLQVHTDASFWVWDLILQQIKTGDVVVDVGAHQGSFAIQAAARGATVIAVEAGENNVRLLRETVHLNPSLDIQVFHCAAWFENTTLRFAQNRAWGMVSETPESVEVPAVCVDGLVVSWGFDRVRCVKMDIEGAEPFAVRGMPQILEKGVDVLYETNTHTFNLLGGSIQGLRSQFTAAGYTSYLIHEHALYRMGPSDTQPTVVGDCLATKREPSWLGLPVHDCMDDDFLVAEMIRLIDMHDAPTMSLSATRSQNRQHVLRELEKRPDLKRPALLAAIG